MDDTNPEKETDEFVNSIIKSVRWLSFDYGDHLYYAVIISILSLNVLKHSFGITAYVDSQNNEQIRENEDTHSTWA